MTSFDYLGGRRFPRGLARVFSDGAADGTLATCLACAIILAAAWALEAEHLRRALLREDSLARIAERGRISGAIIARRRQRTRDMIALMRRLDVEARSGEREAQRLIELANALPAKTWLAALSETHAEYALDGGASGLAELGRAIGAVGRLPHVSQAMLVEAAPAAREGMPQALRYRMRVVWNSSP